MSKYEARLKHIARKEKTWNHIVFFTFILVGLLAIICFGGQQ